ncbi:MAG: site-specific DNA-methyltransferase, partial [Candidatus Paceibacteria bacterium]
NHNREDIDSKWDHSDEAKERLENILDALDFDSPGRARTILNNYQKVSERLLDLWIQGQLSDSHVEQLNNLKDKIVEGVDLEDSETANHSSFEEIVNWSKDENNDQDEYYTRQDLRDINSELDEDAEDEEDLEEKFEILESELDEEDQEQLNEIRERVDDEEQLANSLEDAGDIEEKVDEWDRYTESPEYPLLDERENERKEALEDFDFDDSKAAGEANHLAPPIETDNLGVFFHDCMEMDDEIEDESVQLVFTSPPYFTQRGRIISEWGTGDELTEDNVDTAYENYLDWMIEVIEKCHSKLDVGGHLMLNISDYQPESISKVYDIPSDFSCRIRSQDHLDFEYVSTITWDKGDTETSSRLAQFRKSDNIADFKPAWRTERILVFRKDSPRESRSFTIDRNKLKQYKSGLSPFTDLWKVDATTQKEDAAHEAGFPTTLPYLAVKLFTYPGDTIIDPFGGYATTLVAVRQINKESEEESRKAYAWENFASETESQPDYRQHIKSKVTGIGGKFTEV